MEPHTNSDTYSCTTTSSPTPRATAFASEFLAPSTLLADELPPRLDFELKRRWDISLKALVYRGHDLGIYRDHTYRRGMSLLVQWGYPEPRRPRPPRTTLPIR